MNAYKWRNPTPAWIEVYSFDNYKDTSLTKYANLYSDEIKAVVAHFMEWTDGPTMSWSAFKAVIWVLSSSEISAEIFLPSIFWKDASTTAAIVLRG